MHTLDSLKSHNKQKQFKCNVLLYVLLINLERTLKLLMLKIISQVISINTMGN